MRAAGALREVGLFAVSPVRIASPICGKLPPRGSAAQRPTPARRERTGRQRRLSQHTSPRLREQDLNYFMKGAQVWLSSAWLAWLASHASRGRRGETFMTDLEFRLLPDPIEEVDCCVLCFPPVLLTMDDILALTPAPLRTASPLPRAKPSPGGPNFHRPVGPFVNLKMNVQSQFGVVRTKLVA